jgi:hypothetical protein
VPWFAATLANLPATNWNASDSHAFSNRRTPRHASINGKRMNDMKRLALILAATAFLAAPALAQTDESGTTTNAPGGSNSGVSTGTGAPAGSVNRTGSGKSMSKSAMGKKSMTKKKSGKKAKKSKKSKMKMKKSAPAEDSSAPM